MNDLLRAVITDADTLAEFNRIEERYRFLAKKLPWRDDDFNEMLAINRQPVALATKRPASGEAAA